MKGLVDPSPAMSSVVDPSPAMSSVDQDPLEADFFPTVNGVALHTHFNIFIFTLP